VAEGGWVGPAGGWSGWVLAAGGSGDSAGAGWVGVAGAGLSLGAAGSAVAEAVGDSDAAEG
jgi:hypothetical protein